jgi:hypothetical protein
MYRRPQLVPVAVRDPDREVLLGQTLHAWRAVQDGLHKLKTKPFCGIEKAVDKE